MIIWRSFAGSVRTKRGNDEDWSSVSWRFLASARTRSIEMRPSMSSPRSKSRTSASSLPDSIFEMSRMLLIMVRRCSPDFSINFRFSLCFGWICVSWAMIWAKPRITFMGVRNSWDILARNNDFDLFAVSAISLAAANSLVRSLTISSRCSRCFKSSVSAALRSVISWPSGIIKTTLPVSSLTGFKEKSMIRTSFRESRLVTSNRTNSPFDAFRIAVFNLSCISFEWDQKRVSQKGFPITSESWTPAKLRADSLTSINVPSGVRSPMNSNERSKMALIFLALSFSFSSLLRSPSIVSLSLPVIKLKVVASRPISSNDWTSTVWSNFPMVIFSAARVICWMGIMIVIEMKMLINPIKSVINRPAAHMKSVIMRRPSFKTVL